MFPQTRLRRLRKTPQIRRLVEETSLNRGQIIRPYFVVEGREIHRPIESMRGQFYFSVDKLADEVKVLDEENFGGILLFGIPEQKDPKSPLVAEAIQAVKEVKPGLLIATDVCLCAYTEHGHCGLVNSRGEIQNDVSLELLAEMALQHAKAGADLVAPSDMLDGRVKIIRQALDENGFTELPIMSYSAKFASAFYGPFRDATHSAPQFGDRKNYQLNPANRREAMREIAADIEEGADMVMIKPAMPYLDVIAEARRRFDVPIAAFQVSGEYVMLQSMGEEVVRESLLAIKRAGADIIISYFA